MTSTPKIAVLTAALCTALPASAYQVTDSLEVSGFARAIAGYLDHDSRRVEGYTDEFSITEQSLVAIQPTYSFSDKFSVTSQLIAHASDERDSGVEWLYLSYQPDNAWHFRAGKLRMPFFMYSDSVDVGYSYPWVTPPVQVYNNYLFPTFNGASASYFYSGTDFGLNLETYYGYFRGDLFLAGSRVDVETKVDDLAGLVATVSRNNLSLRLSYHQGENQTVIPYIVPLKDALYANGLDASARSLESDGQVYALQAAISYDTLNAFYKAEWVKTVTGYDIAPEVIGYYLSAGYVHDDLTFHGTYSNSEYSEVMPVMELPTEPTGDPQTDALASAYYQAFATTPNGSLESYSVGVRWDFRLNMALKADVTLFQESNNDRSGFFNGAAGDDANATLSQIAWEWIF